MFDPHNLSNLLLCLTVRPCSLGKLAAEKPISDNGLLKMTGWKPLSHCLISFFTIPAFQPIFGYSIAIKANSAKARFNCFEREVKPHLSDAWIDEKKTKTGYKINFTKYFYEFKPLRSLAEIKADILALEESSLELEKKVLDG